MSARKRENRAEGLFFPAKLLIERFGFNVPAHKEWKVLANRNNPEIYRTPYRAALFSTNPINFSNLHKKFCTEFLVQFVSDFVLDLSSRLNSQ